MQNNQLESKMLKQMGVSLQSLEWFILNGWMKSIVEDPEKVKLVFKSSEDCAAIEVILAKIVNQFAPQLLKSVNESDDATDLENLLKLPPKKLILPQGGDLVRT